MIKWLLAIAVCIVIAVFLYRIDEEHADATSTSATQYVEQPVAATNTVIDAGIPVVAREEKPKQFSDIPPHPMAVTFGDGSIPPEQEPYALLDILNAWRRIAGSFPTAEDNRMLMHMISGNNAIGLRLFPDAHARINPKGELVDGWSTPFFFHHLSSRAIEIRSAGPDKIFYTPDDIVASHLSSHNQPTMPE